MRNIINGLYILTAGIFIGDYIMKKDTQAKELRESITKLDYKLQQVIILSEQIIKLQVDQSFSEVKISEGTDWNAPEKSDIQ